MKIEDIIVILTFIIGAGLFIWYLAGDSPTLEQVILGIILMNLGWTFRISSKLERHLGKHEGL